MTEAVVAKQSRVGKQPIALPKGVTVALSGTKAEIKGPKGQLSMTLPKNVLVKKEGEALVVTSDAPIADAARLQGLGRALLASLVKGCAEGYEKTLELVGTGYRAELKGTALHFALGLSHPVVFHLPSTITADVPKDSKGTIITLTSPDKAALGQAAATIRGYRPPEPYAGKGVRYRGENVRRKAGKAGKK